MKPTFIRTAYNYDMNKAGDESALHCKDPTLTKQSFAEEVDINTIVKRFALTGELPKDVRMPQYGDFTNAFDFQTAMNAIRQAQESFMAMPAHVRSRFDNNPQKFVEFCSDEKNAEEAAKLGLVQPEAADRRAKERARADFERAQALVEAANKKAADAAKTSPKGDPKE